MSKKQRELFEIVEAKIADASAMENCVRMAYQHYVERLGKEPGPMMDDYSSRVENNDAFVLRSGQKVIGVLVLILDEHRCLLDNVAVYPAYSGKGLGKQLVQFAEDYAREKKYNEIQLYTHELMIENIQIYKKWGYEVIRSVSEYGFNRIYMSKAV